MILALSGCVGEIGPPRLSTDEGPRVGDDPNADADTLDDGDPNRLDHERLFACEEPNGMASPARVRRLTPGQIEQRWVGNVTRTPSYASDETYRYSTDSRDVRLDEAATEELLERALQLGRSLTADPRRLGWPSCTRPEEYATEMPPRPSPDCLGEWAEGYLARAWQRPPDEEEVVRQVDYAEAMMDRYGDLDGMAVAAARPFTMAAFAYRLERGEGEPDAWGRRRLGAWQTAQGLVAALTDETLYANRYRDDRRYDDVHLREVLDGLRQAAADDALQSPEQVAAWARAVLHAEAPEGMHGERRLPQNVRRFFQELLGHTEASFVFKSGPLFIRENGRPHETHLNRYHPESFASMLDVAISNIVQEDRQVLAELLTTERFFLEGEPDRFPHRQWPFNLDVSQVGWVTMPAGQRAGLLTHPGWLVAHSGNQHTDPHPVHRGKWIRENLLCGTIPDLPLSVDAQLPHAPTTGVRERLESVTDPAASSENAYWLDLPQLDEPVGGAVRVLQPLWSLAHHGDRRRSVGGSGRPELALHRHGGSDARRTSLRWRR